MAMVYTGVTEGQRSPFQTSQICSLPLQIEVTPTGSGDTWIGQQPAARAAGDCGIAAGHRGAGSAGEGGTGKEAQRQEDARTFRDVAGNIWKWRGP
ncbi:hypothetical protein ACVXG8_00615 [Escherichia coli]